MGKKQRKTMRRLKDRQEIYDRETSSTMELKNSTTRPGSEKGKWQ